MSSSNEFWLNNPKILLKKNEIREIWPNEKMSHEEKLNAISRFVILLTLLGYITTKSFALLFLGLITLGVIGLLYFNKDKSSNIKEKFTNYFKESSEISKTLPTSINPLMNISQGDYTENPDRSPAELSYNPMVNQEINNKTKEFILNSDPHNAEKDKIFNNLGDNLEFENSMHQFVTMPNTTIPNDQKAFTDFCYGTLPSDKNVEEF